MIKILAESERPRAARRHRRRRRRHRSWPASASTTPSWPSSPTSTRPARACGASAITHFTPWDYNWPYGLPDGADGPGQGGPDGGDPPGDDPCGASGSIILCENQVLGEQSPIAGTPYNARLPVRPRARPPHRRLARDPAHEREPAGVAGPRRAHDRGRGPHDHALVRPRPEPPYTFIFDGLDAYGRPVQGRQKVDVKHRLRLPGGLPHAGHVRRLVRDDRRRRAVGQPHAPGDLRQQSWSGVVGGLNAPPSRARRLERRRPPHLRPDRPHALHGRRHEPQRRGPELRRHRRPTQDRSRRARGHGLNRRRRAAGGRLERPRRAPDRAGRGDHDRRRHARQRRLRRRRRPGDRRQARPPRRRRARPRRRDLHRRRGQQPHPPDRAQRRHLDARRHRRGRLRGRRRRGHGGAARRALRRRRRRRRRRLRRRPRQPRGPPDRPGRDHRLAGRQRLAGLRAATAAWPPGPACARRATSRCAQPTAACSSPTAATTACAGSTRTGRSRPSRATARTATAATAASPPAPGSTRRRPCCRCATAAC